MNPPWFTLWNKVKSAVGNDGLVIVDNLDESSTPYVVRLTVQGKAKADALASLLTARHDLGGPAVVIEIKDEQGAIAIPSSPTSATELADLTRTAFCGNGFFIEVVVNSLLGRQRVFVVVKKDVIQFYNDDLSDLFGNFNAVAANVFTSICPNSFAGIDYLFSTDNR